MRPRPRTVILQHRRAQLTAAPFPRGTRGAPRIEDRSIRAEPPPPPPLTAPRSGPAGIARLATDAVTGLADVVESVHHRVASPLPGPAGGGLSRTRGITGLVYRIVRGVARLAGRAAEGALGEWRSAPPGAPSRRREALSAALNGVAGDHLAATGSPLALGMSLRRDGRPLVLTPEGLAASLPGAGGRVLVLVHGLCMNDLQWTRRGHDHGAALAADLGIVPLYLRYNTGLHVSANGRALASLLETLLAAWPVPVEELHLLTHSMGGLVARSACHHGTAAGHAWPARLRKLVFLGTPHHGAPLERAGNRFHRALAAAPYAAPLSRLGALRSAGVTDLRFGSLLDADREGRGRFDAGPDARQSVPLPPGVACYAAAATTGRRRGDLADRLLGDGLVPVESALGLHGATPSRSLEIPPERRWTGYGMGHMDLLSRPEVYERIRGWLAE